MLLSCNDEKIHACGKMKIYRSFVRLLGIGYNVGQTEKDQEMLAAMEQQL